MVGFVNWINWLIDYVYVYFFLLSLMLTVYRNQFVRWKAIYWNIYLHFAKMPFHSSHFPGVCSRKHFKPLTFSKEKFNMISGNTTKTRTTPIKERQKSHIFYGRIVFDSHPLVYMRWVSNINQMRSSHTVYIQNKSTHT